MTHQLTVNRSHFIGNYALIHKQSTPLPPSPFSFLKLCKRAVVITALFGPLFVAGLPLYLAGWLKQERLFGWLKWVLRMAGGSFIKLGQWAATRPDILPPSLCSQLETLQSAAPSHGPEWNEQVIRKCFGMGIGEMFSYFDQVPIGSGTIAQVHRARLKKGK